MSAIGQRQRRRPPATPSGTRRRISPSGHGRRARMLPAGSFWGCWQMAMLQGCDKCLRSCRPWLALGHVAGIATVTGASHARSACSLDQSDAPLNPERILKLLWATMLAFPCLVDMGFLSVAFQNPLASLLSLAPASAVQAVALGVNIWASA